MDGAVIYYSLSELCVLREGALEVLESGCIVLTSRFWTSHLIYIYRNLFSSETCKLPSSCKTPKFPIIIPSLQSGVLFSITLQNHFHRL